MENENKISGPEKNKKFKINDALADIGLLKR